MSYTKRTCHNCGFRDIQPNMSHIEIEYVSGTSNTGMTKRTVFGSIIGAKNSSRQLGKWLLSPSKRVYKRRKTVWSCTTCARGNRNNVASGSNRGFISRIVRFYVKAIVIIFSLFIITAVADAVNTNVFGAGSKTQTSQ